MPIDASIYSQVQPLNIMGNIQSGMNMRQMMDDHQIKMDAVNKQKSIDQAYQSGITKNPDGTPGFDQQKTLSELAKVSGPEYLAATQKFQQQKADQIKQKMQQFDTVAQLAGTAVDQPSYESTIKQAHTMGLDVSQMPQTFDPQLMKRYQMQALSAKDQLENHAKMQGLDIQQQEADAKSQEADAKTQEASTGVKRAQDMHQDHLSSKEDRSIKNQDDSYTKMTDNALKFKGNKALQNAYEGLRNSDAAMKIINSVKDPNDLNDTQYNLLTAEVAKIATGGAATEGATHDARASTGLSNAASFWQKVSGKPTPAQLGEFVLQNKEYLKSLNDVNHKYIDEYQMNNFDSYKNKVSKEQKDEYLSKFGPQARAKQALAEKPQTVIQNGHTYNLNPATGQYE
jgi:hypothetical protein